MNKIELKKKEQFIIHGLDDDCFMLVKNILFNKDINLPILFEGTMFQADVEKEVIDNKGSNWIIQVSTVIDAVYNSDE